ncbi:3'-5' exonuclease [Bacillus sp. AK128]
MAEIQQFVFFDFEMLCSDQGMPFEDMEAIRLGAVKYNCKTEEVEFFDRYIKPIHSKPLSAFCTNLTGIRDEDLVNANSFVDVLHEFLRWVNGMKKSRFFSWSQSDLTRLQHDTVRHQLPPSIFKKIEDRYIDFQAVFSKRVSKTPYSVENALRLFDLEFIGEPHHPMYDAYNTFRIYQSFLTDRKQTDLLMLNHYVLGTDIPDDPIYLNKLIKLMVEKDVRLLSQEHREYMMLKDGFKYIKKVKKVVAKYQNISTNRSGLFSVELRKNIKEIILWYQQLLQSYEEHLQHSSRIVIWDEQTIQDLKRLTTI